MMAREAAISAPVLVALVDDMDTAVNRVKESGGSIVKDSDRVGDMGIVCYFKDTEGNVLGLWQSLDG